MAAPSYHHGDLRHALLSATEALLGESGVEAFTLREVARRAGVSHGAPAHHFGDITGLLSAYTAQSFEALDRDMAERRARASADPFEQLVATGLAYVEFALGHRARFQLMFRSDRLDHGNAALQNAARRAYGHLSSCMAALHGRTVEPAAPDAAAQLAEKTALAWSLVHGFATLTIDNAMFASQFNGRRDRALGMIDAMLRASRTAFVAQAMPRMQRGRSKGS